MAPIGYSDSALLTFPLDSGPFVSDQLADYRRFRVLNNADDNSRFCLGQIVDVSIPGARIAGFLDDLALRLGMPEEIVLDNGPKR